MLKSILLSAVLLTSGLASAACFDFIGAAPKSVGPVKLWGPATTVCVNKVNAFGGRKYWSVSFSDSQGDLAQLASQSEAVGRCPGFCRGYTLTSGNSNGENVNPDGTYVEFQVESNEGRFSISHPNFDTQEYTVRKK